MKTTFLVAGILLFVTNAVSAEQPEQSELLGVMTRTAHWKFESNDEPEPEPLYNFPISNAIGIKIDYKMAEPTKQVEPQRIFSFYIVAAQ